MLTLMISDFVKFALIYIEFFIPFCESNFRLQFFFLNRWKQVLLFVLAACAFWMMFGGDKTPEKYQGLPEPSDNTVGVEGMEDFGSLMFSLFRLTLVDEYDYEVCTVVRSQSRVATL